MSLLSIITNRWFLTALCSLAVFGEMFVAKKWYTPRTATIKDAKVKTALNIVLGIITCFALSAAHMWFFSEALPGVEFAWRWVLASTFGATLIYVLLEKIFGNAVVNRLGNIFGDYISHSKLFDGKLTENGLIAVGEMLLERINKVDKAEADKENKAIAEVLKRFDGFLEDGEVTAEEKAVAADLIKTHNIDVTDSTFEQKYKALLNK